MIELTERDKLIFEKMAMRGWVSSTYLSRYFPSREAMQVRIHKLAHENLVQSISFKDLIKESNFNTLTMQLSKYLSYKNHFYRISDLCYKTLGITDRKFSDKRMIVHQIYQEYIEVFLLKNFDIKDIESNPKLKPTPDLHFEYKNRRVTIEIERTVKKNPNDIMVHEKNKDGSRRSYLRKGFNYDTYIDGLLQFSDVIIYLFETKREREHFFKKGSFSKRVFSGLIDKPETLYDLNNTAIKISDVLSGK